MEEILHHLRNIGESEDEQCALSYLLRPPHPPLQCWCSFLMESPFNDRCDPPPEWKKYCTTCGNEWMVLNPAQH